MFRYGLGHTVEYSLKVIQLSRELYLDNDYLAFAVGSLDVYTVELVVHILLIAFALEYFGDMYLFVEKNGYKSFEHAKISLVA